MYIVLKHLVLKYMFNYNVNNEHFTLEKNDIMRRTISWECIPIIEFAKNKKEYCLIAKYFLSRIQEWLVLWLQCVQWVTHHQKVSTELQGLEAGCILCSEHHWVPAILLKNSLLLLYIHIHCILHEYNWTCIEQHHTKQSPCIKHLVIKIPNLFPLNHSNFYLY